MRIFLLGFMGAGKSTLGPVLALNAGLSYVDLDEEIEGEAGRDIRTIFLEEGEEGFRMRESAALIALADREEIVVATGGGTVERSDNHRILLSGHGVYLRWSWEQIWRRLQIRRGSRPLLAEGEKALHERWLMREPLYMKLSHQVLEMRELGGGKKRERMLAEYSDGIIAALGDET